MKILLYIENEKLIEKSGIGRALKHQRRALDHAGIDYTLDPDSIDYDILHMNTYGLNSSHIVAKAHKMGKKVIYHAHSTEEDFQNSFIGSNQLSPLVKKYLVNLYSKGDHLITPTPYSKSLLREYGLENPIAVISNGIDLNKYTPSQKKEEKFRSFFNIQNGDKVVISVGLFFERKGIIDFVEIARKFPEITFIWFGHVSLLSIPQKIREIVKKEHPENVLFPGYIDGDIIEGAYSGADLFFFPSYEETEGIVVLEALASKQNVLVRDIPVFNGWLKNRENCYMGKNNEDFEKIIHQHFNHLLPDLSQKGFEAASERNIDKIGKKLESVYLKTLGLHYDKKLYDPLVF